MSTATIAREWQDVDFWPGWDPDGWESAAEWSVRDARIVTRGQAHAAATYDYDWVEIGVWKRYLRPLSRQDQWEHHAEERGWTEDDPDGPDGAEREMPETAPADWQADDDVPVWEFCLRGHVEAIPVWIVGCKDRRHPHKPRSQSRSSSEGSGDGPA